MVRLSECLFISVQKFVTSLFLFIVVCRFHCCTHSQVIKLNFGRPTFKTENLPGLKIARCHAWPISCVDWVTLPSALVQIISVSMIGDWPRRSRGQLISHVALLPLIYFGVESIVEALSLIHI